MPTIDVVSDASVALKWFHAEGEEEVEASRALLEHYGRQAIALQVLDLTPYEVGNALLRGRAAVAAFDVQCNSALKLVVVQVCVCVCV